MNKIVINGFIGFCVSTFYLQVNGQGLHDNIVNPNKSESKTVEVRIRETINQISKSGLDLKTFRLAEFDSLGVIHNNALEYAYGRMSQMNLAGLTNAAIPNLVNTLAADFFADRYGAVLNFTAAELKKEMEGLDITPLPPISHNISNELRGTLTLIENTLADLKESETAADFAYKINTITGTSLNGLDEKEQMYLRGYADVLTKSFEYWDRNAYSWADLKWTSLPMAKAEGLVVPVNKYTDFPSFAGWREDNQFKTIEHYRVTYQERDMNIQKRHPCAQSIINSDGSGLLSGLVRGCIVGTLFGSIVGCIPAALFWGGVQAVTASIGAGVACMISQ